MHTIPHIAPRNARRAVDAFLSRPVGQRWLDALANAYPHEAYTPSRSDSFSADERNAFASAMLDAKRSGECHIEALSELLTPASSAYTWHDWVRPDLEASLEAAGRRDVESWSDEIRPLWSERASNADTTSPLDLIGSHDTCEILFSFTRTICGEDNLIHSHRPWSEPSELSITAELQFALNQIGYSVGQFRKLNGNRHESYETLRPKRPRRAPLVDYNALESLISNACSSMFNLYLFAIVPLTDVAKIDLTLPITFSPCWLATMNPMSGTFFEERCAEPVTVNPGDGFLISGNDVAYSPDRICGLHRPHFHGRLTNTAPADGRSH